MTSSSPTSVEALAAVFDSADPYAVEQYRSACAREQLDLVCAELRRGLERYAPEERAGEIERLLGGVEERLRPILRAKLTEK